MAPFQGTFQSIRDEVVGTLRLDAIADLDRVNGWVNLAYQDVCQSTGALQTTASSPLVNAVNSYSLPAAVAEINLVTILYADGTVSPPVQRVTLETILENRRTNLGTGQMLWNPTYAIVGQSTIELWPTPGAGQSLVFRYMYLPDALVNNSDTPLLQEPFGSRVLTYGALVEGARFLKDPLLQDFETTYQSWTARFQQWLNRRQGETSRSFRVRGNYEFSHLAGLARDVG